MNAKKYVVTLQRKNQRDYEVCWCRTLEEAHLKYEECFANKKQDCDIVMAMIEEIKDGKRKTITGITKV